MSYCQSRTLGDAIFQRDLDVRANHIATFKIIPSTVLNQPQMQINTLRETGERRTFGLLVSALNLDRVNAIDGCGGMVGERAGGSGCCDAS